MKSRFNTRSGQSRRGSGGGRWHGPRGDAGLLLYAKHASVDRLENPQERELWRSVHRALNGGGYHLLRWVQGGDADPTLVDKEYRTYLANRVRAGALPRFLVVPAADLVALVNRRKATSRIVEHWSGLVPRSNREAFHTVSSLGLDHLLSARGDVRLEGTHARVFLDMAGIDSRGWSDNDVLNQLQELLVDEPHAEHSNELDVYAEQVDVEDDDGFLVSDPVQRAAARAERQEHRRALELAERNAVRRSLGTVGWFDGWENDGAVSKLWWDNRRELLETASDVTTPSRLAKVLEYTMGERLGVARLREKLKTLGCPHVFAVGEGIPLTWFTSDLGAEFWRWVERFVGGMQHRKLLAGWHRGL